VNWSLVESKVGISHWEYSPPYGPEFNGLAEAFVKLAKVRMMKDMKPVTFTDDGFRTTVELIMESINLRPLTPMIGLWSLPIEFLKLEFILKEFFLTIRNLHLNRLRNYLLNTTNGLCRSLGCFGKDGLPILPMMTFTPKWHEFVKNLNVDQLVLVISPKTDQRCEWPQGIIH
jgi:hypothetical protein